MTSPLSPTEPGPIQRISPPVRKSAPARHSDIVLHSRSGSARHSQSGSTSHDTRAHHSRSGSARQSISAGALLLLLPVVLLFGCGREAPLSVLLITIDTCRADHLSCYGYPKPTTPNIDRLAQDGALFRSAHTTVPMTFPAHASLMTGAIPPHHGVHDNLNFRLTDDNITLAELLQDQGYETGAILSAFVLDSRFHLDQGFATYDDDLSGSGEAELRSAPADPFHPDEGNERRAGEVTRRAIAWLDRHASTSPGKPFFLFAHYFDPHAAYDPPEPFASRFAGDPYAGEIAYTDDEIGKLLDHLRGLGLYESTAIVIIGDHGEGLGEHGEELHDYFIYQSTIHVPLVMRLPGMQPGRQIEDPVSIIDIAPTLLAVCGLGPSDSMAGIDLSVRLRKEPRAGTSGNTNGGTGGGAEVNASADTDGEARVGTNGNAGNGTDGSADEDRERRYLYCESINPARYGCNPVVGIVSDRWKFIRSSRPELYDLRIDPGEFHNVIEQNANRAAFLEAQLEQILAAQTRQRAGSGAQPDQETRERLQSLGYLSGSGANVDLRFDRSRPDAKDYVHAHALFLEASQATSAGDHERAERLCAELLADYPRIIDAHLLLGGAATARQDLEAAEREYRRFLTRLDELARGPDGAVVREQFRSSAVKAHFHLANALIDQGKRPEAIEEYRNAIALDPSNSDAHFNLGITLAEGGNVAEALERFLTTVDLDPDFPEAHYNAGLALLMQGRPQEGRAHLETAIRLNPSYVDPRLRLADILLSSGDVGGAMTQVRAARDARPDLSEPHLRLARMLLATGDARSALEVYREAARTLPDRPEVANELAWILATHRDARLRNGDEAREIAEKLVADYPGQPALRATLAAAYAEVGRFDDAAREQEAVVASVRSSGDAAALQANQEMLERFRRGEPLRR